MCCAVIAGLTPVSRSDPRLRIKENSYQEIPGVGDTASLVPLISWICGTAGEALIRVFYTWFSVQIKQGSTMFPDGIFHLPS